MSQVASALGRLKTPKRSKYDGGLESPMTVIPLGDTSDLPASFPNWPSTSPRQGQTDGVQQQPRGPLNTAVPLYVPRELPRPIRLGARDNYDPLPLHCGNCGYKGYTYVKYVKGLGNVFWAIMTCGLGLLCPAAWDAHHYCQQCHRQVAIAKPL